MNKQKKAISDKLQNGELEGIEQAILEYEKEVPEDLDLFSFKVMYFLMNENYEEALAWAYLGVKKNPYSKETNYNLAYMNEIIGDYDRAIEYYCKAMLFAAEETDDNLQLKEKVKELLAQYTLAAEHAEEQQEREAILNRIKVIREELETGFGLTKNLFKEKKKNIGVSFKAENGNEIYTGFHRVISNRLGLHDNMMEAKGEMRRIAARGTQFQIQDDGCERIIPILTETQNNVLMIKEKNQEHMLTIREPYHYSHIRIRPGSKILAHEEVLLGKPIPVKHNPKLKKLVFNIFIDGLSQKVMEEEGYENIMPNTYRFFQKGTRCENTYSGAEWTYPSIATYMSGLDTINHMMLHNMYNITLPSDTTLLSEYFSEAGYQTAKIGGNWRVTPNYGYIRGVDRCLFQHQWSGMRAQEVIPDALDHLELMKDTDHFLWLSIGDLHDIADGLNLQPSVEAKLYPEERKTEMGITSAKQPYSENKRKAYLKQATMIDRYLSLIYQFIEQNYQDDEIIVSLMSDHGQGYFVKPDQFFLAPERTKVAFMFRGGNAVPAVSKELMASADYIEIMTRLAGITRKEEKINGRLPKQFGGENEREYVLSESIHPGDCYCASIYWKDYICNFKSNDCVGQDARFQLEKGYTVQLVDYQNQEFDDSEKVTWNLEIIIEHIAPIRIYE